MDDLFLLVSRSQRQIHAVETRVTDYLSQGFLSPANTQEYVSLLVIDPIM